MKEIIVRENEAGQRLDKLLAKYLSQAPKSFLYKMMRKKNITINGKKAGGNEITSREDVIRIFLSDETFEKFAGKKFPQNTGKNPSISKDMIVYEDHHILILNKPVGILSQKANPQDISMNERLLTYLLETGELTGEQLQTFRPGICNRLDRNTSGLLIAGKTLTGLQEMSHILQDRSLHKYYQCLVRGQIKEPRRIEGFLSKDSQRNQVQITKNQREDGKPIITQYTPLRTGMDVTFLEVWLITGRSHQIRAHLASQGHPIAGDSKYGKPEYNRYFREKYGLSSQFLHSARMVFPEVEGALGYLSGKEFQAPLPLLFDSVLKGELDGNMEFQRT